MSRLRVHCFSISLDGFGAGPGQDLDNPLGKGGEGLHSGSFRHGPFRRRMEKAGV